MQPFAAGGTWVELHSVASSAFPGRGRWIAHAVATPERCSALKFEFRLASGSTGAMQLGQIAVYERVATPGCDAAGHELSIAPGGPDVAATVAVAATPAAGAAVGWMCSVCGGTFSVTTKHMSCSACRYELCASCRLLGGARVRRSPFAICLTLMVSDSISIHLTTFDVETLTM